MFLDVFHNSRRSVQSTHESWSTYRVHFIVLVFSIDILDVRHNVSVQGLQVERQQSNTHRGNPVPKHWHRTQLIPSESVTELQQEKDQENVLWRLMYLKTILNLQYSKAGQQTASNIASNLAPASFGPVLTARFFTCRHNQTAQSQTGQAYSLQQQGVYSSRTQLLVQHRAGALSS